MPEQYAYICDLRKCTDCSYPKCSHTTDIRHRLTKEGCKLTEMKLIGSYNGVSYYAEVFKKKKYLKEVLYD